MVWCGRSTTEAEWGQSQSPGRWDVPEDALFYFVRRHRV